MKLLAIETSSIACSIALQIDQTIFASHQITPNQQTKLILPEINSLLSKSHVLLEDLDAIAFGCGPGSFTGVRIATSVAQGLGFAAHLPLIPISSLAALAQSVYDELGWKKLFVATDARMGEVYSACYEVEQGLVKLHKPEMLCPPSKLILPEENSWYGVGNGWESYKEAISYTPIATNTTRLATAEAILRLASPKFKQRQWQPPTEVEPIYLRTKVAD